MRTCVTLPVCLSIPGVLVRRLDAAESRDEVDSLIAKAVAAGGRTQHPPEDHGFMDDRGFEDVDGHLWTPV